MSTIRVARGKSGICQDCLFAVGDDDACLAQIMPKLTTDAGPLDCTNVPHGIVVCDDPSICASVKRYTTLCVAVGYLRHMRRTLAKEVR